MDKCDVEGCGFRVTILKTYTLAGAGFGPPGTETIVWMETVKCSQGHRYDREAGSVEMKP